MKRSSHPARLAWAVVALIAIAIPAAAENLVPFKGALAGRLTDRTPYPAAPVFLDRIETTGTATLLGEFELIQIAVVDLGVVPPHAEGVAKFVAANGDTLTAEFTGSSVLVGPTVALITENATITGGTGRFADARGSFTIQRLFDRDTLETIGSFSGTICPPRR